MGLFPFVSASAEEVISIHPRFDSGRVSTSDISTTNFAQWTNGVGATRANNVGWNEQRGIWYSFIRFAGPRLDGTVEYGLTLEDWHTRLLAAGSITLRGDVNWLEVNTDFPVDPGVPVSVWLVPGFNIAEGSLPGFANTWPWNYPNAVKVTSFDVSEFTPLRPGWNEAEANPVDTRDKMSYAFEVDLTDAISAALAAGHMSPSTPWGIVLFPEEMETQLNVPNNPAWIDQRQTVFNGAFWQVVLSEDSGTTPTWAGFPMFEDGWVFTGSFMGFVFPVGDFVFVDAIQNWVFLPESLVEEGGAWTYVFR
ncbi:MAG: hypothetical protein LR015_08205 [Verrucomicrobia bacterium]|nr:hypothetical protein [Verrucomicrobiota bacterium]